MFDQAAKNLIGIDALRLSMKVEQDAMTQHRDGKRGHVFIRYVVATAREGPPPDTPGGELEAARTRIAELERKVGQQQLELDFFRQALRQVRGARRPSAGPGVTGSTESSKR